MKIYKGIYKFDILDNKNVVCGISTRNFGNIKEIDRINKKKLIFFSDVLGINFKNIIFPKQIHGSDIRFINNLNKNMIDSVDGLITDKKRLFLGVLTADCLPICFWDSKKSLIGIAHAGYKGILKGIIAKTIGEFKKLGSNVINIKVGVGPSIGVCCYNVNYARIALFNSKLNGFVRFEKRDNKYFLDLKTTAANILFGRGILKKNTEILPICTKCNLKTFFSLRGDTNKTFGEFVTLIGQI